MTERMKDNPLSPHGLEYIGDSTWKAMGKFSVKEETVEHRKTAASRRYGSRGRSEVDNSETETSLTAELISIGSIPKIKGRQGSQPFFWRPEGEGVGPARSWDARTREIGEQLYSLEDGSLDAMRRAHEKVVATLGPMAGHALSAHWHEIGEQQWQDGNGECWMH